MDRGSCTIYTIKVVKQNVSNVCMLLFYVKVSAAEDIRLDVFRMFEHEKSCWVRIPLEPFWRGDERIRRPVGAVFHTRLFGVRVISLATSGTLRAVAE